MTTPPQTPKYQPSYCEENIWKLCDDAGFGERDAYAVFISNAGRTCALWSQRAAPVPGAPIGWDYHVVLVDDSGARAEVWDLDSALGAPVAFERWWQATFPFDDTLPDRFRPRFRVVPADDYLATFASDRSHMRDDDGGWIALPPPWDTITQPAAQPDETMNLDSFIDMKQGFVGEVLDPDEFRRRFSRDVNECRATSKTRLFCVANQCTSDRAISPRNASR